MEKEIFRTILLKNAAQIEEIRQMAYELHKNVNQTYGTTLPYGYHLDMVANVVRQFGHLVCVREADVLPLMFGAFFHDTIEDARQSYNDVKKAALRYLDEEQALIAVEIVYALTNEKGRTRGERAGERYYAGIRQTPYAPFVKLCDRVANVVFSCSQLDESNQRMKELYRREMPHFLSSIQSDNNDARFAVPSETIAVLSEQLGSWA